jgi:hypothetical protein
MPHSDPEERRKYQAERHRRDPERRKDIRARNKQRDAATNRAWNLRKNYGITEVGYANMLSQQNGRCAICGGSPRPTDRGQRLQVDHDHRTGMVRQLLCSSCNYMIGHSGERPEVLEMGAEYVRVWREKHASRSAQSDRQMALDLALGKEQ